MICKTKDNSDKSNELLFEFLDFKINDCLQSFREKHKEEYKVIFELIKLMGSLKDKFIGKEASQRDIFLLSSIIELNRLFQSAVLLFEKEDYQRLRI